VLHILILVIAFGYPYMRELPHSTEPSPEFGSEDVSVVASTALRSTNWQIRQASGDKEGLREQAETNYKVESSILREYKVQATVYNTKPGKSWAIPHILALKRLMLT
jgi:hypothetical protein